MLGLKLGAYRLTKGEVGGAFADLGVLVPLETALITINGLNPTTTLLGVGLSYVAAGWYFGIPMSVQPLKAFGALAVAMQLSPATIAAGALLMAGALFLLAVTGLVEWLYRVIPLPVVRGIQFGLGLILLKSSFQLLGLGQGTEASSLGVGTMVGGFVLLALLLRWPVFPASVAVLGYGVLVGVLSAGEPVSSLALGPAPWQPALPGLREFQDAFWLLVIPQLPLTLANSVLATTDTAQRYFGDQADRATPRRLTISIALSNLWAGLAGGLPTCHGSGGLTAHYKLGARTPLATSLIGAVLITVGLLFGQSALAIRELIPLWALGVLLLYVGIEHLRLGLAVPAREDYVIVGLVGASSWLAGGNLAIGAAVGIAGHACLKRLQMVRSTRSPGQ